MKLLKIKMREWIQDYKIFALRKQHRKVKKLCESLSINLELFHAIEGSKSSARFEKEQLIGVQPYKSRETLFEACLNAVEEREGLYLEFGTYKGDSINLLAKLAPKQTIYGFDSFTGLPDTWTVDSKKGNFDLKGKLPLVRDNVKLVKGWYSESLPEFIKHHPKEKIAFIHIDCDLYSSTKTVLELLRSMLAKGTLICFDEYYNYSEWLEGEYKAFIEFTNQYQIQFEYIGYIRMGRQVAVKIT